jgi:hypothetical protein
MSVIIRKNGNIGPFKTIEKMADKLRCDGVDYFFTVIGDYTISEDDSLAPTYSFETTEIQKAIREQRNKLLAASDWTQVADAPVDKAAWATYRQELRDISEQPGFPATVVWPTQPE